MKNRHKRVDLFVTACIALGFSCAFAQQPEQLTIEWLYSDEGRGATALPQVKWLNDGAAILYDLQQPESQRTLERLDPVDGARKPLFRAESVLEQFRSELGSTAPTTLPWPTAIDAAGQEAVYILSGDLFLLDLRTAGVRRITTTTAEEKDPVFSPDDKKIAFVRANDLYIYDLTTSKERRLTTDGSNSILNGTLSWVYWEEIFGRQDIGFWWSEDSSSIAFLQSDESPVTTAHFTDFLSVPPRLIEQKYPKAGTANPIVRVGIVDIASSRKTWIDRSEIPYEYVIRVKWLPDNRLSLQTMNRDQTRLDLWFIDRSTAKASPVLHETDERWVNIHDDLYFLHDGKHFLWSSERDGYRHLYRYDLSGKLVNQITIGPWALRSSSGLFWVQQAIVAVDEQAGWIYFTALEKSPTERHLYRIRFDGTGMERLTKQDGVHRITFSLDRRFFLDAYSNVTTMPVMTLCKTDGTELKILARSRTEAIAKFGLGNSELISIPTTDGFRLPALLFKPAGFDRSKRYPLILYVYGGPSAPQVSNLWSGPGFEHILNQEGYLVAWVDPRVATGISKKLENMYSGSLGSELKDLEDATLWFKSQNYVDASRVGIWGWSGGGTYTLAAMTRMKEFKAGIAVAAVTDWHYYDTKWAEAIAGQPAEKPETYEQLDLNQGAKNLYGRLLLVQGTYDDNVHPQNTWHFIDELVKAGKMFDLMMYPMRGHGIADKPARIHLYKTMLEYWKSHL